MREKSKEENIKEWCTEESVERVEREKNEKLVKEKHEETRQKKALN